MPGISATYAARLIASVRPGDDGAPYIALTLLDLGQYAHKGYGTAFITALQAMARQESMEIRLTSVDQSQSFWRKCGFVRDERFAENGSGTPLVWRAP